ncbi:hypothetical protein pb186bvf_007136 [Paramecium bursaria]
MDNQKFKVVLNMYDLSQGMAKQFSPIFLGKQIDAIWHTGIVVYGKEYYFGGGICASYPKQTGYGYPIEERPLGETEIPQVVFEDFLRSISSSYTMEKYDLFTNNCNNFTNECCQFLLGQGIPEHITGLPQEFLNTQLGQMMKPMIEQMTNKVQGNNENFNNPPEAPQKAAQVPVIPQPQNQQPQPQAQPDAAGSNVIPIDDLDTFICCIESSPKCIIDFYTDWCGPCKAIKPIFNKLSNENQDIQFYNVNIDKAKDIAQQLQVTSIPTFAIYQDGQLKEKWTGGNPQQLTQKVSQLK